MCPTGPCKARPKPLRHAVAASRRHPTTLAFSVKAAMSGVDASSRSHPAADTMEDQIMPVRLKKLIGTVIIVALVVLYALIATTIASYRLAESAWYVHMLYFLFTGILWIVPAMFVIRWMERPPKHRQS